MKALIRDSPITCNGPIYSTYGNSTYPVAAYCTWCAKGSKANNSWACRPNTRWHRGILPSSFGSPP